MRHYKTLSAFNFFFRHFILYIFYQLNYELETNETAPRVSLYRNSVVCDQWQ